jgi:hypothetical protein
MATSLTPAKDTPAKPACCLTEPLTINKTVGYKLAGIVRAIRNLAQNANLAYVTDAHGRTFWLRVTVDPVEVDPVTHAVLD